MAYEQPPQTEAPDIREKGAPRNGQPQILERRLYMQLQAFTGCRRPQALADALRDSGLQGALYLDVNDPLGVATLVIAEDPALFTTRARELLTTGPFEPLERRPDLTMIGRTYSTGREQNLKFMMLDRPSQTALNPEWPWAVWYPLRRRPEFALLPPEEQGRILAEHAAIGMAFGGADYAHDVRLACHGLDRDDNEFVIGLVGRELYPLSRMVQEMRKTQQTAKYIQTLGPFFVGRVFWQSPPGK